MLKTMFGRRGKDARSFFAMSGCQLPPDSDEFTFTFVNEGSILLISKTLVKGLTTLSLPAPVLGPNNLLLLGVHPAALEAGLKVELPIGVYGREALSVAGGIIIKLTLKEEAALQSMPIL